MGFEFAKGVFNRGAESKMVNSESFSPFQKIVEASKIQAARIVDEEASIMELLKSDEDFQTIMSYGEFGDSSEADVLAGKYIDQFPHVEDSQERAALIVAIAKAETEKTLH